MGFFRRIGTILGFIKDEVHAAPEEDGSRVGKSIPHREARGFGVKVPIAVEKTGSGPVVLPCSFGEGGVQGFRWYSRRLRIDEDGDVADEFLEEVVPPTGSCETNQASYPSFEVKYTTRPAPVRKQAITSDGNVYPCMEHQGMLRWV
ncbi:hypothetical protein HPP92_001722 [Vanilla planifolia]|uniref:Uncharacterized protein n=1 Tax=Vanilla planifolia TaxID=51239 RepID=A0A835RRM0_VANPL|nr:hypothetical protein HPP92_001567 [Vanilla planifolia]KAG0497031.1 hypothetical protein HPP92_001722 [Vanilla planifolia]